MNFERHTDAMDRPDFGPPEPSMRTLWYQELVYLQSEDNPVRIFLKSGAELVGRVVAVHGEKMVSLVYETQEVTIDIGEIAAIGAHHST